MFRFHKVFDLSVAAFALSASTGSLAADYRYDSSAPVIQSANQHTTNMSRCAFDQLPSDLARIQQRLDWAERCKVVKIGKKFTHWYDEGAEEWQPLPLPKYPVFTRNNAPTYDVWIPDEASCSIPDDVVFYQICAPGCFEPTQQVLFADGYRPIREAKEQGSASLVTLAPDATLDAPTTVETPVQYFTESERDAYELLATIETAGGGRLVVTLNHPLVTASGEMQSASLFKVGDSLVTQTGTLDPIVRIDVEPYFGKVYNVAPSSADGTTNVIVAEGYLNGSHKFQTGELRDYAGFRLRRPALPAGLAE